MLMMGNHVLQDLKHAHLAYVLHHLSNAPLPVLKYLIVIHLKPIIISILMGLEHISKWRLILTSQNYLYYNSQLEVNHALLLPWDGGKQKIIIIIPTIYLREGVNLVKILELLQLMPKLNKHFITKMEFLMINSLKFRAQ